MNERIEKLAMQADLLGEFTPTKIPGRYVGYITEEQILKFAELIVRECADHCDLLLDHKISSEWSRGTHDCSRAIKEHFGVAEPKGWICPKCSADRTKIACPLGFGATVDGRCPMTVEAQ